MELRLRNVVIDCNALDKMLGFWSRMLGYELLRRGDHMALLAPEGAARPRLYLQRVPEPRRGKNRLHLDLDIDPREDLEEAVRHAEGLGAERVERHEEDGLVWWLMSDPEGNLFCMARVPES